MKLTKATIFIPTKNAGKQFYQTLNQISKQREKNFEVIIVDSGSTDKTLQIAENFKQKIPMRIYKIHPKEFGHGKTRNLSLKYARGKFIIFLTQDAIPLNNVWLSYLLSNFKDKKVAGVFSRQIANKKSMITERFFYECYYPNKKIISPNPKNFFFENIFFSNVSSSIRKSVLKKFSFNESIIMCEDQDWAKRIINKGYKKIYEPKSIVIHLHNRNLNQTFQRFFDSTVSMKEITGDNFKEYLDYASANLLKEISYVLYNKPLLMPYLIVYDLAKITGTQFGIHNKRLPAFVKKQFSSHRDY